MMIQNLRVDQKIIGPGNKIYRVTAVESTKVEVRCIEDNKRFIFNEIDLQEFQKLEEYK